MFLESYILRLTALSMANIIEKSTTKETKPETNVSAQKKIYFQKETIFNIGIYKKGHHT